jgi:hypothetical protein
MPDEVVQTPLPNVPAAPSPSAWVPNDVKPFVEAKGWKSPADVISGYQNLEKLQRTPIDRTLVVPEKEDAPEWGQIFDRLGRPKSPADYKFDGVELGEGVANLIQGEDGFAAVAHKLGLSQKAAGELVSWFNQRSEGSVQQTEEQIAERHTAELEQVKTAWGAAFEPNVRIAKAAVSALGLGAEELEQIENALGTEWLMKTFHRIGTQLGEHARPADGGPEANDNGFGLSPAQADAKLRELLRDEAFSKRYFEGDKDANDRVQNLTKAIAGTGLVRPDQRVAR